MTITKNIIVESSIIEIHVSCNHYKECEKVSKEIEEKNVINIKKRRSGKNSYQIYGEYKY